MRLPRSWNDRRLLNDEPFRSVFREQDYNDRNINVFGKMAEDVSKWPEVIEAAIAWLDFAFVRSDGSSHDISLDIPVLGVFVGVFWHLHLKQDAAAQRLLHRERLARGFRCDVDTGLNAFPTKSIHNAPQLALEPFRPSGSTSNATGVYQRNFDINMKRFLPPYVTGQHHRYLGQASPINVGGVTHSSSPRSSVSHEKHATQQQRVMPSDLSSQHNKRRRVESGKTDLVEQLVTNGPSPTTTTLLELGRMSGHNATSGKGKVSSNLGTHSTCSHGGTAVSRISEPRNWSQLSGKHPLSSPGLMPSNTEHHLPNQQVSVDSFGRRPTKSDVGSFTLKPVFDWACGKEEEEDQYPESVHDEHDCGGPPSVPTLLAHEKQRPTLQKKPPIWAMSRQEVCESFDWFRSYQSGVYHTNGTVRGYLLSGFPASRDQFHHDGKLIISHGGGKSESLHSQKGQISTHLADDQRAMDSSVRALLNNHRFNRRLVLLVDDKYALFPYDLARSNVTYAVLGLYTITHAWAEHQPAQNDRGTVVRYKFCFQWCEGQGNPWWWPTTSEIDIDCKAALSSQIAATSSSSRASARPSAVKVVCATSPKLSYLGSNSLYRKCPSCQIETPHVYAQGWMCLNSECPVFWKFEDGSYPPLILNYSDRFLQLQPPQPHEPKCPDLRPRLPKVSEKVFPTSHAFTKGWHCKHCGRLSCRFKWEHYECSNCQATHMIPFKIREPNELWFDPNLDFLNHKLFAGSGILFDGIQSFRSDNLYGEFETFTLPEGRGYIHLIISNRRLNQTANEIFKLYQKQAMDGSLRFRRWPLRSHKCRGPLLTNYFSQNVGEPYQYVGGTANTVPFSEAPSAVQMARELIEKRAIEALNLRTSFNEVLSAAYMERQKMAFHGDSEPGLGPVVGSLSLGSPALMHFRLHSRFNESNQGGNRIALTFILRHGDVVIMQGADVQTHYDHPNECPDCRHGTFYSSEKLIAELGQTSVSK